LSVGPTSRTAVTEKLVFDSPIKTVGCLIILWGLNDRTEIFSTSNIPKFGNWLDPGFQLAHLRLISHDSLIGETRPSFREFREGHNKRLAAGVTVAVLVTAAHAGQVREDHDRSNQARRIPVDRLVIDRVRMSHGKPYIEIQTVHVDQWDRRTKGKRQTSKLFLTNLSSLLVLDRVQAPDLTYYLTSRTARRSYAEFVEVFKLARSYVEERDATEAPWHAYLRDALLQGGYVGEPHQITAVVLDALSVARSATRSGKLPALPSDASAVQRHAVLNAAHAAITDHTSRVELVKTWSDAQGYSALALSHTGTGSWVLYRAALAHEQDRRIDPFPWVVRLPVSVTADQQIQAGEPSFAIYQPVASEQLVHEWPEAHSWLKKRLPHGMSHEKVLSVLDRVHSWAAVLDEPTSVVRGLIDAGIEFNRKDKTRSVARLGVLFPLGTFIRRGEPFVLAMGVDAIAAAYAWGSENEKADVVTWITRTYQRPSAMLARLNDTLHTHLTLLPVPYAGKRRSTAWVAVQPDEIRHAAPTMEDWKRERKEAERSGQTTTLRLTELSPAGARLFPWLLDFCEAGTKAPSES